MSRSHPSRRRSSQRHRSKVSDTEIYAMRCPCCDTEVRLLGLNIRRLAEAAAGRGGNFDISSDAFSGDWTVPVSDERIEQALASLI